MEKKYIHYCWFGTKPLPKLAKKCIKSWKKYLPDYEIIEWNEKNYDVNYNEFSKKAYEAKKWGFVADVARVKALKEYGGIYFDTDMLLVKSIDDLLEDELFLGWESQSYVAVGIMGVKKPNHPFINDLIDFYNTHNFNLQNIYDVTIPVIFTKILREKYGLLRNSNENQRINDGIVIYTSDYFYPINYDYSERNFTSNTKGIHYYNASWASKREKFEVMKYRVLGKNKVAPFNEFIHSVKVIISSVGKMVLFPLRNHKRKKRLKSQKTIFSDNLEKEIRKAKKDKFVAIYNSDWLGTACSTNILFENTISINEMNFDYQPKIAAEMLVKKGYKLIVFSAFAIGYNSLVREIKKLSPETIIKVVWHGSDCMNIEKYDFERFNEIVSLHDEHLIESIGLVKKSMYEFYKQKGYRVEFLMNYVDLSDIKKEKSGSSTDKLRIGLYASGDRWLKNFYNQLAAASLVGNAIVDCIPVSNKTFDYADRVGVDIVGETKPIERDALLKRLSHNQLNLYVTFTECAPLLPLESLEMGVPCITGNNHHYFEGTELRDYLVVDQADNIIKIKEKIDLCLNNRDKILKLYKDWRNTYIIEAKKSVDEFKKVK